MAKRALILILLCGFVYGAVNPVMTSFNAGEVTPLLKARADYTKYDNACQTLQNMLVMSQGPVRRRPGTKYIAAVKDHTKEVRLVPFEYSKTDAYILEFGNLYMRVYRNGGQVQSAGNPYEIVTSYDANEAMELQYVQSADVMYLVHPNDPPQKLTRTGHAAWAIADVNFTTGPFMDENETTTTIEPSAVTGSAITLTASADTWNANHVGALWQASHRKAETSLSGSLTGDGSSSTLSCAGDYDFTTHGRWTGTVSLERSFDNGSVWESVHTRHSENDDNIAYGGSESEDGVIYRVTMSSFSSGSCTYNFSVHDYMHHGIVRITGYSSAKSVTARVLTTLGGTTAVTTWAEGYWSDDSGWPDTVEFHEERLVFGGNSDYPQTVWLSKTDDYENMSSGTDDDDAIIYCLPGQNPIQWMISQAYLFMGTLGGAGRLGATDEKEAITPTNLSYKAQSRFGSKYIQATLAGDSMLYVERGGRKVRELLYQWESDKYAAPDMTLLSEHITDSGIVGIAYQSRPDSVLWCVRDDGVLATMTYKREEEVVAWARQVTDGSVESVAVIPGSEEDEVWVCVNRTIDGSTKRYIEQFQPIDWGTDQDDCFFVDSGLTFDGGDAVNITAVTKADPAVVTVSTWPTDGDGTNLSDGDQVKIASVSGMTELNGNIYTISNENVGAKTFELRDSSDNTDIDSIAFTTYTSGGTAQRFEDTFTNLSHLEGEALAIMTDGASHAQKTVSSGTIQLDVWANKVHSGLPFTSQVETMPIVWQTDEGSTTAKIKRISGVTFDFYETLGVEYGPDSSDTEEITFYSSDDDLGDPIPLYTGFTKCSWSHGYNRESSIFLQQTLALPVTIRAIIPTVELYE